MGGWEVNIKVPFVMILILLFSLFLNIIVSQIGKKIKPSEHTQEEMEFILF